MGSFLLREEDYVLMLLQGYLVEVPVATRHWSLIPQQPSPLVAP